MKKEFIQAIKENDILTVRLSLTNELLLDPRGATFEEMLKFAESHCTNLYDTIESSFVVEYEPNNWNQCYLNDLKNELDSHFLRHLLKHYKDVILVVLKDKVESLNLEEKKSKKIDGKNKNELYKKIACGSLLLGGAALTITGLSVSGLSIAGICLSKGVIIKTGTVCLLSGSFVAYKLMKN